MPTNDAEFATEATFVVDLSPAEAWFRLESASMERSDPDKPDEWWLPGWETAAVELDRTVGRRLTARKMAPPCEDTIIELRLGSVVGGTRIDARQSEFDPAFVAVAGEAFPIHADHIFRDLHLFFAAGAIAGRASLPWTPLGLATESADYGLRVTGVEANSWAERIGIEPGDVLLTVHGAPIFDARDLGVVERVAQPGANAAATRLHGSDRRSDVAEI